MPIHDWTRVEAGDFHDFHQCWVVEIRNALNRGLLPPGYPEVARRISSLRAPDCVQERIDELAEKSSEGTLSADERAEYEAWVRAINWLGILQAKARKVMTDQ
jgi:hypothetical protein